MKKGDFVIIGVITAVIVLAVCLIIPFFKPGDRVVIKQNDLVVYDESIDSDANFDTGTNTVVIRNGEVYMESSVCKNQICVNTGKISKKGEKIICLPNRVTVEIK